MQAQQDAVKKNTTIKRLNGLYNQPIKSPSLKNWSRTQTINRNQTEVLHVTETNELNDHIRTHVKGLIKMNEKSFQQLQKARVHDKHPVPQKYVSSCARRFLNKRPKNLALKRPNRWWQPYFVASNQTDISITTRLFCFCEQKFPQKIEPLMRRSFSEHRSPAYANTKTKHTWPTVHTNKKDRMCLCAICWWHKADGNDATILNVCPILITLGTLYHFHKKLPTSSCGSSLHFTQVPTKISSFQLEFLNIVPILNFNCLSPSMGSSVKQESSSARNMKTFCDCQ